MGRKIIITIAVFFITLNVMIVLLVIFGGKSSTTPVLPNPNGYDDFVKAGTIVAGDPSGFQTMGKEALAGLVSSNVETLKLVRLGLSRECLTPIAYTTNYASDVLTQPSSFKRIALMLAAEGRLAELEGRTNDAAKIYVDGVRFAQEASRGGLLISRLVGIACESIASTPLSALDDKLDAQSSRQIAQALEVIDAKEESVRDTLTQEKQWSRRTFGLKGQIASLNTYKQKQKALQSFEGKVQSNTLRRRNVMTTFASRAYELEKGKRPQSWADLAPGYLKAIPQDPTTGTNIVFRP